MASLVIHSTPRRLQRVAEAVSAVPGVCIHATSAAGKLVVSAEASTADEMARVVSEIQRIDGVLSAALVYQCADTLAAMNEELSDA
ncbi:MAG: chaperone NapD [Caldimonas sp.]